MNGIHPSLVIDVTPIQPFDENEMRLILMAPRLTRIDPPWFGHCVPGALDELVRRGIYELLDDGVYYLTPLGQARMWASGIEPLAPNSKY